MIQRQYDVVIVGAGAAGIGMGVTLRDLGLTNFVLLERHEIGASFLRWPQQMRFISPSFPSNGFGLTDLNAITFTTSPGFTLQQEHPSGAEYAHYLQSVAAHYQLPIETGIDVMSVEPLSTAPTENQRLVASVEAVEEANFQNGHSVERATNSANGHLGKTLQHENPEGFALKTSQGLIMSRFVIWAAGEFQYPNHQLFPGSELCQHNASVRDWSTMEGDEFVIIGGYESGIDAAINLVQLGKRVRVLDDFAPWAAISPDPSLVLSPYTQNRLRACYETGRLELVEDEIEVVEQREGGYWLQLRDGESIKTNVPPILATGFSGSLSLIEDLLEWHPQQHYPLLTPADESVQTPGLFLSGPFVRHGNLIFCFIYKFRQRFAVIANTIGKRLGVDTSPLERYRTFNFYLDDLSCCDNDCVVC